MNEVGVVIIVIAVAAAFAVGLYLAHKAAEQRRLELLALARELGLSFDPSSGGPDWPHRQFDEFKRGHSRRTFNTLSGNLEFFGRRCPSLLGDYEYKVTSSSGKSQSTTTYRFSYLLVQFPWTVPALTMRQENLLDKLAGAIGFDDIDFESEEFSRRFHVKCSDKRFAYDVIHPRMMEFLLAAAATPIEFAGGWCLISDGSRRWDPSGFRSRVEFARQFFGRWPEHLLADLESRAGSGGMRAV